MICNNNSRTLRITFDPGFWGCFYTLLTLKRIILHNYINFCLFLNSMIPRNVKQYEKPYRNILNIFFNSILMHETPWGYLWMIPICDQCNLNYIVYIFGFKEKIINCYDIFLHSNTRLLLYFMSKKACPSSSWFALWRFRDFGQDFWDI